MKRFITVMFAAMMLTTTLVNVSMARQGFYLGMGIPYNTIKGDFDGKRTYVSNNLSEQIIVPEIDGAFGLGIIAGYGFTPSWAIEISLLGSRHNAKWLGADKDVDYSVFNIDAKYSFMAQEKTQPYLLIGLNTDSLVVKDGVYNASGSVIGDATYRGGGLNLGGGVDHYISQNVSLGVGATLRIVNYNRVEGLDTYGDLPHRLNGNSLSLMADAAYHF